MTYFYVLAFFLGASIGSFLPVLFYRRRNHIPLTLTSRSICDFCGEPLDLIALIPVFGYLLLCGKSRCCKQPLRIQYPLYELALGLLFVLITFLTLGRWAA